MRFESPLAPYSAIKKAEQFFEKKVLNSTIKEQPLSKRDEQLLEIGVSGGFVELYWMKIYAQKNEGKGSTIQVKSRLGLMQLSVAAIIIALGGAFLYYAIARPHFFTIFVPSILFIFGILGIIVPLIRINSTQKDLKEALSTTEPINENEDESTQKSLRVQ